MRARFWLALLVTLGFAAGVSAHNPPQGTGSPSTGFGAHAFGDTGQLDVLQIGSTATELFQVASGILGLGTQNDGTTADGTLSLAALTAGAQIADSAPTAFTFTGNDAFGGGAVTGTNDDAGNLILAGGIGQKFTTVIDFSQTGYTVVLVVNGTTTTLTEGVDWTNVTDDPTSATALEVAIEAVSGVSSVVASDIVYITPDAGTYSLDISETGTGNTVTEGTDGNVTFPGLGSGSEIIGAGATDGTALNCTVFGVNASTTVGQNSSVSIGHTASSAGDSSVSVGASAAGGADDAVCVGVSATTGGTRGTAVGARAATTSTSATSLGADTDAVQNATALGAFAQASFTNSIGLGILATTTKINQLVIGAANSEILEVVIGDGVTNAAPMAQLLLTTTNGVGTDIHSTDLVLSAGLSTGAGASADMLFQTGDVLTTGATLQTAVTRLTLSETAATFTVPVSTTVTKAGHTTTLGAETAVEVFSVTMADADQAVIMMTYSLRADDSSEYQTEGGTLLIVLTDDGGGVVASTPIETSAQALSSGTLTSVWAVTTTDDQSIEITLASVSSLTQTTHEINFHLTTSDDVEITTP